MQHVAGMLDAILGCHLGGREAVVPGAVELLIAAASIVQLVRLTRHDRLLLGYTRGAERESN